MNVTSDSLLAAASMTPAELGLSASTMVLGALLAGIGIGWFFKTRERLTARQTDQRFRELLDVSPLAVMVESDGALAYANHAASKLLGGPIEELLDRPMAAFIESEAWTAIAAQLAERGGGPVRVPTHVASLTGETLPVEVVASRILYNGKQVTQLLLQDLTERKAAEARLHFYAYHDPLTGLSNRPLFAKMLDQSIAWAKRHDEQVAVMVLDVDRFKEVNDSLGHDVGDRLLVTIAKRLQEHVRQVDTIARIGGDEFFLVCPHLQKGEVTQIATRLLALFNEPIALDGQEFHLSPSIGISVFPADGESAETLTRNADMAMYRVKSAGGNSFHFYAQGMGEKAVKRRVLEAYLRKAIPLNELVLFYQAQVDMANQRIIGAEALIRWRHPELGLVSPMDFIPVAEDTGLIVPITEWVLTTACRQMVAWQQAGHPNFRIAVNLSARHFSPNIKGESLVELVTRVLAETGLDPRFLELEITETTAMQNLETTIPALRALHAMGIWLAIDDFGTGYSSLSYLKKFPIHAVKIDRAFVKDLENDTEAQAIVKAILAMSAALKLKAIAEGVETIDQWEFLREHDCDLMQGFLFSKPVPEAEFEGLMRDYSAKASEIVAVVGKDPASSGEKRQRAV